MERNERMMAMQTAKTHRVLLVSSNKLAAPSLENFFEGSSISIVPTALREDGIQCFRQTKFDAVITDLGQGLSESLRLRQDIRALDEKLPILFLTPTACWSDVRLLDQIVEDPHSYYIPENAGRKFMLAKLSQVITAYQAENAMNQLQSKIARNWFLASLQQQAMLPPWVYFNRNYEFSCLYRPFTRVSGDLFQWLPLDEDRALFVFGDISGHGTHSALAMNAIQSFLAQTVMLDKERAARPWLIAADINDFFCQHLHNIVHMSTLVAYIDFRGNCLRYLNSGCMDLLCVDAETGEVIDINPKKKGGIPLGLVKNAVYTCEDTVEYHFRDTAVFLFCSDGLMALAKDKDGSDNMDMAICRNLIASLTRAEHKAERSIALPFRCLHSLEQFGYVHPQDDLTMVLVRKSLLREREYVFACRVPADKKAVDEICQRVSEFVTENCQDEALSVSTELLLEEYLVNIIMHGLNENGRLNEYIAIKLCAYEYELKVIIWDRGREWNGFFLSQEKADASMEQLNQDMSASGRGIPIISKIASQISRQRYCGLNETVFIIPRQQI